MGARMSNRAYLTTDIHSFHFLGLPQPQSDHPLRMSRFARLIMDKMGELTSGLEIKLGPDTGDLKLRVGLHSGKVTAGVLRGEKARFQLFGDTGTLNFHARSVKCCKLALFETTPY